MSEIGSLQELVKLRDIWLHLAIRENYLGWVEQMKASLRLRGKWGVEEVYERAKRGGIKKIEHEVDREAAAWIIANLKKGEGMKIETKLFEEEKGLEKVNVFGHEEFGDLRLLEEENQVWFVGNDVAKMLGYSNARDALAKHVFTKNKRDDVAIRDTIGRDQKTTLINEAGMYQLILKSKLPKAEKFQDWVTAEALPKIRRAGSYVAPSKDVITADFILQLGQKMKELEGKIKDDEPKVEGYEKFLSSEGLFYIKDAAKACGWKQREFFEILKVKKIIHRLGDHYQSCFGYDKYFKLVVKENKENPEKPYKTLMVTAEGMAHLTRRFSQDKAMGSVVKKIQAEVMNG